MPVSLLRRLALQTGGNFGSPKLDLGGCVLYAPLWRPDQAGSPFNSKSAYGVPSHACTVVGATWGLQGRTFDGSDDKILVPDTASLDITVGAVEFWIKWIVATNYRRCFSKGNSDVDVNNFTFEIFLELDVYKMRFRDSVGYASLATTGVPSTTAFQHIVFNHTGAAVQFYVDTVSVLNTARNGTLTNSSYSVAIGCQGEGAAYANAIFGEARIYNRALTAGEIMRNYLATRWRYQ